MKYPWLREYCASHKGALEEYKAEWEVIRFMLKDKMFIMIGGDNQGREIITLKLAPSNGEALRAEFKDVRPGHYMNKIHWNSIDLNGSVPNEVLKKAIDESYELVLNGLSRKAREEIINGD